MRLRRCGWPPGRIAEAYAVVYVAGWRAKHFGILPADWDPFAIALESCRGYVASIQVAEGKSVRDLFKTYAARADDIDLNHSLPDLTDEEMATVSGFRKATQGGTELIVPAATITRLFVDWERRNKTAEIDQFLLRDGEHLSRKRAVRRGCGKERLHVFSGSD